MEPRLMPYKTVSQFGQDEIVIHKSRFIGLCAPCTSEEQALDFLAQCRARYKDANHHCYAYIIGRNAGVMRYSDDGEPGGTAGLPIIGVLKSRALVDVAVVVVRYFGGVLLGAGGLTRAYTQGCAIAAAAAGEVEMCPCRDYLMDLPYGLLGRFENEIKTRPLQVLEKEFGADVTVLVRMRDTYAPEFLAFAAELTAGKSEPILADEGFFPWAVEREEHHVD
jgi:uncharacterized YigZ family protein